jgi:hypothetical protein
MHFDKAGGGNNDGLLHQQTPEDFRATPQSLPTVPIAFTANGGQAPSQYSYYAQGPGYNLFLNSTQAVLSLPNPQGDASDQLTLTFAGGNAPTPIAASPLGWQSNFFTGSGSFIDQMNYVPLPELPATLAA